MKTRCLCRIVKDWGRHRVTEHDRCRDDGGRADRDARRTAPGVSTTEPVTPGKGAAAYGVEGTDDATPSGLGPGSCTCDERGRCSHPACHGGRIGRRSRLSANQILVAWLAVAFAAAITVGLTVGITAEILVGFGAAFATWPLAEWAMRREERLLGNPERFRGIGE